MKVLLHYLNALVKTGMQIQVVYDVGAFTGAWSTAVHDAVLPDADFVLFEANPAHAPTLAKTGFQYFTAVLSNPGREHVDFYSAASTGDSYYKETTKWCDEQGSVRLPCTTLDELVRAQELPTPDFMKLDTQGSELDILAGSESFLDQVKLVYCECPIVRYNRGAPDIQQYLDYFRCRRFLPLSVLESHHLEYTLLQIDIMFIRQDIKEKYLGPNENIRPLID